jgi:hypothetical protein
MVPQLSRKTRAHLEVVPDGSAVQLDRAMSVTHVVRREPSGVLAWARQTPSGWARSPCGLLVGSDELLLQVATPTLRIQLCHAYQNACVPFHVLPETGGGVSGLADIHGKYAGAWRGTRTQRASVHEFGAVRLGIPYGCAARTAPTGLTRPRARRSRAAASRTPAAAPLKLARSEIAQRSTAAGRRARVHAAAGTAGAYRGKHANGRRGVPVALCSRGNSSQAWSPHTSPQKQHAKEHGGRCAESLRPKATLKSRRLA